MADSKQKCLNRIVWDIRIGEFLRVICGGKKVRFRTADRRQLRESGKQLKRYVAISPDPYNRARTKKPVGLDWRILYNICTSLLPTCPP